MKAIIFDCDGTLVDSELVHYSAWAHALQKQGFGLAQEEYSAHVGTSIDNTSLAFAKKIGKNCIEELKNDKSSFFRAQLQKGIPPIHDTLQFLHKLIEAQKQFQYKLAVASGASKVDIMAYLRHLQIEEAFEVILSGKDDLHHYNDPEGVNKPKPYIYLEAAKLLGVHPSDCVAIEDSYTGVMASARAGCVTVAIPHAFSLNHDFSASHLQLPSLLSYTVDQFLREAAECKKFIF